MQELALPLRVTSLYVESKRVSFEVRPQLVPSAICKGGSCSTSTRGRHVDRVESEVVKIKAYMWV